MMTAGWGGGCRDDALLSVGVEGVPGVGDGVGERLTLASGGIERLSAALVVGGFVPESVSGFLDAAGEDLSAVLRSRQRVGRGGDAGFVEPAPPALARRVEPLSSGLKLLVGVVVVEFLLGAAQLAGAVGR